MIKNSASSFINHPTLYEKQLNWPSKFKKLFLVKQIGSLDHWLQNALKPELGFNATLYSVYPNKGLLVKEKLFIKEGKLKKVA